MMRLFLLLVIITFGWAGCAPEASNIQKYRDYLNGSPNTMVYYQDVVSRLGDPDVSKEHENDIVASWTRTFTRTATIATQLGGEKLLITFDKKDKKMLKWDYKTW